MSWVVNEWKDGLPPRALQKVGEMEKTLEKMTKERQQRQFQLDSLEQALERQKRVTQEEKHSHSELQREIQTLADSCEQLSKFKSKCEQELQVKVQHIGHLEAQLRNSKTSHGDANKGGRHHAEPASGAEDLLSEKDNTIKKLELQLAEAKQQLCEARSANLIDVPASGHADQAIATIKRLEQQLKESDANIAEVTSKLHSHTPQQATGNISDIRATAEEATQKLTKLEADYKKLSSELECQRHNAMAAREAVEAKWKEKEKNHKAEMSVQADSIRDMQRHVEEQEKKHAQEKNRFANSEQQMQSKTAEIESLKKKHVAEKDACKSMELALEKKTSEMEAGLGRHREMSAQVENMQMRIDALQKEKIALQTKCTKACELADQKKRELFEMVDMQKVKSTETDKVRCEMDQQAKELKYFREENRNLATLKKDFELKMMEKTDLCINLEDRLRHQESDTQNKVIQLKSQVENFKLSHEKAEEQAKQLSKINSQLNGELEGKEARLSKLVAATQDMTAKGKQIENLLQQEKKKSTDLQHNLEKSASEMISLSLTCDTTKQELAKVVSELAEEKRKIDHQSLSHISDLQQLSDKVTLLEKELKATEETCLQKEQALQKALSDLKDVNMKTDQQQQQINQLEAEVEIQRSETEYFTLEKEVLDGKVESLENELKQMEKSNEEKLEKSVGLIGEMKIEISRFAAESANGKSEIQDLTSKLENAQEQIKSLTSDLSVSIEQKAQMQQEIDQLKRVKEMQEAELERVTSAMQALKGKLEGMEDQLKEAVMAKQNADLKSNSLLDDLRVEISGLTEDSINAKQEIKELSLKLEQKEQRTESVTADLSAALEKKGQMQQEIDRLKNMLETQSSEMNDVSAVKQILEGKLETLEDQFRESVQTKEVIRQKSDSLVADLRAEIAGLEAQNNLAKSEIEHMSFKLENSQENIESVTSELAAGIELKEQMQQEIMKLKTIVESQKDDITLLSSEKKVLEGKLETVDDQLNMSHQTIKEVREKSESFIAELKSELAHLQTEGAMAKSEIGELRFKLENNQEDIESVTSDLSATVEQKEQMLQEIKQLKLVIDNDKTEIKSLTSAKQVLEGQLDSLEDQLTEAGRGKKEAGQKLESLVSELRVEISRLEAENSMAKSEIQEITLELENSQQANESVSSDLAAAVGKSELSQQESVQLKAVVENQKSEIMSLNASKQVLEGKLETSDDQLVKEREAKEVGCQKSEAVITELKNEILQREAEIVNSKKEIEEMSLKLVKNKYDMASVTSGLSAAVEKREQMQQEIDQLKTIINTKEAEFESINSVKEIMEGRLETLEDHLKESLRVKDEAHQKSESLVAELRVVISQLEADSEKSKSEIEMVTFKLENNQEDMESVMSDFTTANEKKDQMQQEIDQLKAVVETKESEMNSVTSAKQILEGKLETLEDQLKQSLQTNQDGQQKSESLVAELRIEISKHLTEITKAKSEIEEIVCKLENNRHDLESATSALSIAIENKEQMQQEILQLKNTIESCKLETESGASSKEVLEGKLETLQDQLKEAGQVIEDISQKSESLMGELKSEITLLKEEAVAAKSEIEDMTGELEKNEEGMRDQEVLLTNLKHQFEQTEQQNLKNQQKIEELQLLLQQEESMKAQLGDKLASSESSQIAKDEIREANLLKADALIAEQKLTIASLNDEKQILQSEIETAQLNLDNGNLTIEDLSKKGAQLQENEQKLALSLKFVEENRDELKHQLNIVTKENADEVDRIGSLTEEVNKSNKLQEEFVNEKHNLRTQIQHMKEDHAVIVLKLAECEENLVKAQNAAEVTLQKNEEMSNQAGHLSDCIHVLETNAKNFENQLTDRDSQVKSLEETIRMKELEVEKLQTNLDDAEQVLTGNQRSAAEKVHNKDSELQAAHSELENLQADILQMKTEFHDLEEARDIQLSDMEKLKAQHAEKVSDLSTSNEQLVAQIKELEAKVLALNVGTSDHESIIDKKDMEMSESYVSHKNELANQTNTFEQMEQNLRTRIAELEDSLSKAKEEMEALSSCLATKEMELDSKQSELAADVSAERFKLKQMEEAAIQEKELMASQLSALSNEHQFAMEVIQAEKTKLEEQLSESHQQILAIKESISKTDSETAQEVAELRHGKQQLENIKEQLTKEISSLQKQLEVAKDDLKCMEDQLTAAQDAATCVQEELQCELQVLVCKYEKSQAEKSLLEEQMCKAESTHCQYIVKCDAEKKSFKNQIDCAELLSAQKENVICDLEQEVARLKSECELNNNEIVGQKNRIESLESKLVSVKGELSFSTEEMALTRDQLVLKYDTEIAQLEGRITDMQELHKSIMDEQMVLVKDKSQEIELSMGTIAEKNQQISSQEELVHKATEQIAELGDQLNDAQTKSRTLEARITDLECGNSQMKYQIDCTESDLLQARASSETIQSQQSEQTAELDQLKLNKEEFIKQISLLDSQVADVNLALTEAGAQIEAIENKRESLFQQVEDLDAKVTILTEERDKLQERANTAADLEHALAECKNKIDLLVTENCEIKQVLESNICDTKNSLKLVQQDILYRDSMMESMAKALEEEKSVNGSLEEEKANLSATIEQLRADLQGNKVRTDQLDKSLTTSTAVCSSLESEVDKYRLSLEEKAMEFSAWETEKVDLEGQVSSCKQEVHKMQLALDQYTRENEILEEKIAGMTKELNDAVVKGEQMEVDHINELDTENDRYLELKEKLLASVKNNEDVKSELETLSKKSKGLKAHIDELEKENQLLINGKGDASSDFEEQLNSVKAQLSAREKDNNELLSVMLQNEDEIAGLKTLQEQLKQELENSQMALTLNEKLLVEEKSKLSQVSNDYELIKSAEGDQMVQVAQLQSEKEELSEKVDEFKHSLNNMEEELVHLQKSHEDLERENKRLTLDLEANEADSEKLRLEIVRHESLLKSEQSKLNQVSGDSNSLKSRADEQLLELASLQSEKQHLITGVEKLEKQLASSEEQCETMRESCQKLEDLNSSMKISLESEQIEKKQLADEMELRLTSKEAEIKLLVTQVTTLKRAKRANETTMTTVINETVSKQNEIAVLSGTVLVLERNKKESDDRITVLETERKEVNKSLKELSKGHKKALSQLEAERNKKSTLAASGFEAKICKAEAALKTTQSELAELSKLKAQMSLEHQQKLTTLEEESKATISSLQDQHKEALQQVKEQLKAAQDELQEHKEALQQMKKELKAAQEELHEAMAGHNVRVTRQRKRSMNPDLQKTGDSDTHEDGSPSGLKNLVSSLRREVEAKTAELEQVMGKVTLLLACQKRESRQYAAALAKLQQELDKRDAVKKSPRTPALQVPGIKIEVAPLSSTSKAPVVPNKDQTIKAVFSNSTSIAEKSPHVAGRTPVCSPSERMAQSTVCDAKKRTAEAASTTPNTSIKKARLAVPSGPAVTQDLARETPSPIERARRRLSLSAKKKAAALARSVPTHSPSGVLPSVEATGPDGKPLLKSNMSVSAKAESLTDPLKQEPLSNIKNSPWKTGPNPVCSETTAAAVQTRSAKHLALNRMHTRSQRKATNQGDEDPDCNMQ